jgi:hypothetical protein
LVLFEVFFKINPTVNGLTTKVEDIATKKLHDKEKPSCATATAWAQERVESAA